jgi:hypothetical protein
MKNLGFRLIISLFIGALFLASLYKVYMILNSLVLFQEYTTPVIAFLGLSAYCILSCIFSPNEKGATRTQKIVWIATVLLFVLLYKDDLMNVYNSFQNIRQGY